MYRCFLLLSAFVLLVSAAAAQTQHRRAVLTDDSRNDRGKCTIEVVVDGSADIEIRGDSAILRNQSGQQPQWRRFECTGRIPANPVDFRFSGVDGRGRQQLIRDPQNGNVAIVRIEDRDGGPEGYTFDLTWDAAASRNYPAYGSDQSPERQGDNRVGHRQREGNRRFDTDDAIRDCQDAVREQAARRFNGAPVTFRTTTLDDQPGHRDRVVGTFELRGTRRGESHQFSCSVDFEGGRMRSVEIGPPRNGRDTRGTRDRTMDSSRRLQACERAVLERVQQDGYSNVELGSINADPRPGRSDLTVGTVRGNRDDRSHSFSFSCSVDNDNMAVRSIDLTRR